MDSFLMKPMGVIGIIDRTIKLYRAHFKEIILFTLLIGGTLQLISSLFQLGSGITMWDSPLLGFLTGQVDIDSLAYYYGDIQPNQMYGGLGLLVVMFIYPLVVGGVYYITLGISHGGLEKNYFSQVCSKYDKLLGTFWAGIAIIIGFFVVAGIIMLLLVLSGFIAGIIIAAILIVIAAIVFFILYALAFPVAIQENRYGFAWFPRAFKLFTSKIGKTIGLLLLTFLIVGLLGLVLQLVFALLPPLLRTVGNVLLMAILQPVHIIATALLYLDIRMTTEGYDLEIRLAALQNAARPINEEIGSPDE